MTTSDRPHFLLVGHEGSHNRGCEALVRTTIDIIRLEYPNSRFTVASQYPEHDAALLDIPDLSIIPGMCSAPHLYEGGAATAVSERPDPQRLVSLASRLTKAILPHGLVSTIARKGRPSESPRPSSEADFRRVRHLKPAMLSASAVISIGGDHLSDDFGPPFYAFETVEYAQLLGCKTVVWGASIWPYKTGWVGERATTMFRGCSLVTVRDRPSYDYLSGMGLSGRLAKVADGAFLMPPRLSERSQVQMSLPAPRLLGFSGSGLFYCFLGQSAGDELLETLLRFLHWLIDEHKYGLVLVPHDAYPAVPERDFLFDISQALERPGRVYLPPVGMDARETKAVIGQCELFVAMRFHPSIAALSQAIPTLGMGYSPKFAGLHEEVYGHAQFLVPYEGASLDTLKSRFENLKSEKESVARQLGARIPDLQASARRGGQLMRETLG